MIDCFLVKACCLGVCYYYYYCYYYHCYHLCGEIKIRKSQKEVVAEKRGFCSMTMTSKVSTTIRFVNWSYTRLEWSKFHGRCMKYAILWTGWYLSHKAVRGTPFPSLPFPPLPLPSPSLGNKTLLVKSWTQVTLLLLVNTRQRTAADHIIHFISTVVISNEIMTSG